MEAKLQALKVPELKKLLQDANLPVSGTKAELIKRLLEQPAATASLGGGEEEDLLGEYETEVAVPQAPTTAPAPVAKSATPSISSSKPASSSPPKATNITSTPAKLPSQTANSTPTIEATDPKESAEDKEAALIAELEKRKARAAKFGLSTAEAEAKLQRVLKFGVEAGTDPTLNVLEGGLKGAKKTAATTPVVSAAKQKEANATAPIAKSAETEEEKAARLARQEADEAAKKRRAERFGLPPQTAQKEAPSKAAEPAEEERKRKRMERFGGATTAEPADKKVKA